MKITNKKWYSIIELLVVITLISILSTLTFSFIKTDSDKDLINKYYSDISYRVKEIYDKVLLWQWISEKLKYIKISCNTWDNDFFAYNCYSDLSWNIECKQIFFPNSYKSWNKINSNWNKKWFLKSCWYNDVSWNRHILPNFYYYIDTNFPYKVYKKLNDDENTINYNNNIDSSLNIDKFFIEIQNNDLIYEKTLNF